MVRHRTLRVAKRGRWAGLTEKSYGLCARLDSRAGARNLAALSFDPAFVAAQQQRSGTRPGSLVEGLVQGTCPRGTPQYPFLCTHAYSP